MLAYPCHYIIIQLRAITFKLAIVSIARIGSPHFIATGQSLVKLSIRFSNNRFIIFGLHDKCRNADAFSFREYGQAHEHYLKQKASCLLPSPEGIGLQHLYGFRIGRHHFGSTIDLPIVVRLKEATHEDREYGYEREMGCILYPGIQEEDAGEHMSIFCANVCCKETSHAVPKQVDFAFRMALADLSKNKANILYVGMIVVDMACQAARATK